MKVLVAIAVTLAVAKLLERRLPRWTHQAVLTVGVLLPLAATFYAMSLLWQEWITWRELALFFALYLATGLGTTLGYHRLAAHQSFDAHPVVKFLFLALGSMALQGHVITWVAHHLKHHANSDRPGDPHSPLDGLFHAHVGWILRSPQADRERYCKRLLKDPIVVFVDRTAPFWVVLGLFIPYAVAGWSGLLWGGFVRIAFTNHVTFAVNSVCHSLGSQQFATGDKSRNNWLVAALAFGEGWHNNHHAFPSMAYHGMTWRQVDLSRTVIRLMLRLGLISNVKQPSVVAIERRRLPSRETAAEG